MWLLSTNADGTFKLNNFPGNIPSRYAILSHTWEADDQEVTFQDLMLGIAIKKKGYRKIQFCSEQAMKDGLQYFWVDSCCIDRSNSTELSAAINSMFRWYRNAAKCYAYLSDVSTGERSSPLGCSQILPPQSFSHSRWFTRGWTVQELLAPLSVEFFSQEGIPFGDKVSLKLYIHQITGIPVQALNGDSFSQFSVKDRISWIASRETTIEEDIVYSIFGIFNLYMPLIYGEGVVHAFRRLADEIEKSEGKLTIRNIEER